MPKRFLLIAILATLPLGADADDTIPTDAPETQSTPAPEPSTPAPSAPNAASDLGPQASSTGAGGSNADATALQPAGQSALQSTTNDATGLTAPNANTLQAPIPSDGALKVLAAEADGEPRHTDEPSSLIPWLIWSLIIAALVGTGALAANHPRVRRVLARKR